MWEFHTFFSEHKRCWSWKCFDQGRLQRQSGPSFRTVREAMTDAGLHGFESHINRWHIFNAESNLN